MKKLDAYSPLGYSSAGEVLAVGDGVTGLTDLALIQANFDTTTPSPAASQTAVPEPSTMLLVLNGVLDRATRKNLIGIVVDHQANPSVTFRLMSHGNPSRAVWPGCPAHWRFHLAGELPRSSCANMPLW